MNGSTTGAAAPDQATISQTADSAKVPPPPPGAKPQERQATSTNSDAGSGSSQAAKSPEATSSLPVRVVSGVGHIVSWFMKHVIESGLPKDIVVTVEDFAVLMAAHPSAIQIEKMAQDVRQIVLDITGKGLTMVRSNPPTLVKTDENGDRLALNVSHETTLTDKV